MSANSLFLMVGPGGFEPADLYRVKVSQQKGTG